MSTVALQAIPRPAQAADPGVAELKQMVADVGTWTAGLADAGKLAEKLPLVGTSAGSVLGFPDLVQKAVADQISTLDSWSDYGGSAKTVDLGGADGRTGTLTLTNTASGGAHTVTFHLQLARTQSSQPFAFANTTPKVNLSSSGGVSVTGAITLDFAVTVDPNGGLPLASLVNDATASPHFSIDVTASLPASPSSLSAAIGILGVNITADGAHRTSSIHLAATVDDPDGDGRLYRTMPNGTDGELKDLAAAAGLIHVGFAGSGAGSIDADLTLTATSNGAMSLPAVNASVGIHWADISTGSPNVTVSGLDPIDAFQRLSPRDLADMLGQLVSVINGSERSPANKPLPFLSGTLADAVKGAESLVDFLKQNVVQPPATPSDPIDPAKVGEPSFRSIQELIQKLAAYTGAGDFAGSTFVVSVGTYANDRLPIDLSLKRTVASEIDLVRSTVAVTGSGSYTATTFKETGKT
ncbi:MAG: hypothetical protein ABIO67_03315, partial [Mycobacteriales bacterium]